MFRCEFEFGGGCLGYVPFYFVVVKLCKIKRKNDYNVKKWSDMYS